MVHLPDNGPDELERLLRRSWARAGLGLRAAWPEGTRLSASQILRFLLGQRFCALAFAGDRVHVIPVSFHMDLSGLTLIPAGEQARRMSHLALHPWAAVLVGPESAPGHRVVRVEGPSRAVATTDLPAAVLGGAETKLGDLSWCASWLQIQPSSVLGWGVVENPGHSAGSSSRSPG